MRIIAFSDIHGRQDDKKLNLWFNFHPADLLIFAGDLQRNQTTDFGREFLLWFHELDYPNKILVLGNHDGHYVDIFQAALQYSDITILNNTGINFNGIKIYGSPHSVEFGSWWFMMKDDELTKLWELIPDDTDILITHGPPFGILDYTFDGHTTGSKTLFKRISQLNYLKYHIFGHIHESYGIQNISGKTFLNVSLLNEKYLLVNEPTIIDYV